MARLEAAGMEQGAEAMRCAELSCERWEKTLRRMRDDLNATAGGETARTPGRSGNKVDMRSVRLYLSCFHGGCADGDLSAA